jgi:hypothetical protein
MLEQGRDGLLVAAHDGAVQRGESRFVAVGVRAFVEQEPHDVAISGKRRKRRGAHAPRVLIVHVRACFNEEFRRREITDARCEHQRSLTAVRDHAVVFGKPVRRHGHHLAPGIAARVDVCSADQKTLHHIGVLLCDSPHQRRLSARAACIRIRPLREQCVDDSCFTGARRRHQRRFAREQCEVWIRAGSEQPLHDRLAAVQAGRPQRRDTEIVRRIYVSAAANQLIDLREIVSIGRPVQRRRSIA